MIWDAGSISPLTEEVSRKILVLVFKQAYWRVFLRFTINHSKFTINQNQPKFPGSLNVLHFYVVKDDFFINVD